MKKAVLKLNLHDDKTKHRAMKTVSGISGVDSVSMDMKDQKLTVTGDIDPVIVVTKLRKFCVTEMVSVGAAKEEKNEPKKPEEEKDSKDEILEFWKAYQYHAYNNPYVVTKHDIGAAEEYQNCCVIC